MAHDLDEDDDLGDAPPTDDELREALQALRSGEDASLGDVLKVSNLAGALPDEVMDAIAAVHETRRDLANGGIDQVVWNHGLPRVRAYAAAWTAVGAIENGELLSQLADALAAYRAQHDEAELEADPVAHFLAYRRSVGGPAFAVPDPAAEVGEAVIEYVVERAAALPDPGGPLPPRQ